MKMLTFKIKSWLKLLTSCVKLKYFICLLLFITSRLYGLSESCDLWTLTSYIITNLHIQVITFCKNINHSCHWMMLHNQCFEILINYWIFLLTRTVYCLCIHVHEHRVSTVNVNKIRMIEVLWKSIFSDCHKKE